MATFGWVGGWAYFWLFCKNRSSKVVKRGESGPGPRTRRRAGLPRGWRGRRRDWHPWGKGSMGGWRGGREVRRPSFPFPAPPAGGWVSSRPPITGCSPIYSLKSLPNLSRISPQSLVDRPLDNVISRHPHLIPIVHLVHRAMVWHRATPQCTTTRCSATRRCSATSGCSEIAVQQRAAALPCGASPLWHLPPAVSVSTPHKVQILLNDDDDDADPPVRNGA